MNRLQATLLEEKDVVTDTRKRNTILTLVAWLKRILQTSSNDNNSTIDAQLFALTDLLPAELLLSKLMPQLPGATESNESALPDRSAASSKRFSRQRNKRFNTVGVSREELADARLYLQKKLLSENLAAHSITAQVSVDRQNIIDDDAESRRKSLNISFTNHLNNDIDNILDSSKRSFSKSIDIVPSDDDLDNRNKKVANQSFPNESEAKVVLRRMVNGSHNHQQKHNGDPNPTTDTDDDVSERQQHPNPDGTHRAMNKFSLRKLKMKRANTIDIPKTQPDDTHSSYIYSDENTDFNIGNVNVYSNASSVDCLRHSIQTNCNSEIDKDTIPTFQPKTSSDHKYLAFLNKQTNENRLSWVNPNRGSTSPHNPVNSAGTNWSNKFGNIKNAFERQESSMSPGLSKKNNFTHAPTSPFMPVRNSKPPQIPNGHHHQHHTQQVSQKIAAIQSNQTNQPYFDRKPQLKSYKSVPSATDVKQDANGFPYVSSSKAKPAWSNKFASVDKTFSSATNNLANNLPSYNPLYIPLHNSVKQPNQTHNNAVTLQATPSTPPVSQSPVKTPLSPLVQSGEFPSYTYTCTDYTRPACVSTFGPENASPVKTPILPDTSYIKVSPNRTMQPTLASTRLSKHMKTVDYTSSTEYLSEPNSFRVPHTTFNQNIDTNNDYHALSGYESNRDSQEFTATSQIMKYPECQTATVINKTRRYDQTDERAKNLHTFLTNNVQAKPRTEPVIIDTISDSQPIPFNTSVTDTQFSHVNKSYVPPIPPYNPNSISNNVSSKKFNNNYASVENLSRTQQMPHDNVNQRFGSQILPNDLHSFDNKKFDSYQSHTHKSKPAPLVKVNSYGGQYIQPKIESSFQTSKIKIQKKTHDSVLPQSLPSNVIMNNVTNLSRSNTIMHRRPPPIEIKRKQSLPAQNTDYNYGMNRDSDMDEPRHNYLPAGVLKKSKSGHTLALLQQFESKDGNSYTAPTQPIHVPRHVPNYTKPEPIKNQHSSGSPPKPAPVLKPVSIIKKTQPVESVNSSAHLQAPKITETPSSPTVEEHIIYPGQTLETRNKVQNYAQTLNAIHNRKSIIIEDDKNAPTKGILQKSKSGSLLSIPKQYETVIKKSEVEDKQRTVAAYFSGQKSPQALQRSSSQHSVLSTASAKSLKQYQESNANIENRENIDYNGNNTEISSKSFETTTTTSSSSASATTKATKSAHHLKILKKQQKQTTNSLLAKSQTMPHISSVNLLDESNVDDAFEDLFLSFNK